VKFYIGKSTLVLLALLCHQPNNFIDSQISCFLSHLNDYDERTVEFPFNCLLLLLLQVHNALHGFLN